jgi:hypothetical protein
MKFLLRKLMDPRVWGRIARERLTEPLHLNVASLFVMAFGSFRSKVLFDLVLRPHNAYSLLKAADQAKSLGIQTVSVLEFGVATGAGLMNLAEVAKKVTEATGVKFKIYGFDTGKGMPPALDYRDHPEMYQQGDYVMNAEALRAALPENVQLIIGDVAETTKDFAANLPITEPVGYVILDVDYYSSSVSALNALKGERPEAYLPMTRVYMDDIFSEEHNPWCGELAAVEEFNQEQKMRKICFNPFIEVDRLFKKASWLKHVWCMHTLDHPHRSEVRVTAEKRSLFNPYLNFEGNAHHTQLTTTGSVVAPPALPASK